MADALPAAFRSGGKVYEMAARDEITPRDLLTFPRDAAEVLGYPMSWHQVGLLFEELDALDEKDADDHPMADFLLTVMIWVSRRAAGDKIRYSECLDEPFEWVQPVAAPQDHKPGKASAQKGGKKKSSRPKGSGQAARLVVAPVAEETTPQTSESASATAS